MQDPAALRARQEKCWAEVQAVLGTSRWSALDAARQAALQRLITAASANGSDIHSPAREVMSLLGDRWTPLLLTLLVFGPLRFSELQKIVDAIDDAGISRRMLSLSLRGLEREGMVARKIVSTLPPHVEYSLTEIGTELCSHLVPLLRWIDQHHASIVAARAAFAQQDASL